MPLTKGVKKIPYTKGVKGTSPYQSRIDKIKYLLADAKIL